MTDKIRKRETNGVAGSMRARAGREPPAPQSTYYIPVNDPWLIYASKLSAPHTQTTLGRKGAKTR